MSATLCVLFALLPQGEIPSVGRVVDLHGKPVADATVLFLSRPLSRSLVAGVEDRRTVTTDERGRYRIELNREHRYTVWAGWPDGATACSEGVAGGEFLELRGAPDAMKTTLRLPGIEDWPGSEAFTVRGLVGGENVDFVTAARDGDQWRFPPMPPMGARAFEILDANGEVRWCSSFISGRRETERPVPELEQWDVTVVDAQGDPIAGAALRWHIRNYWYSLSDCLPSGQRFRSLWPIACVTDADGEGTISVPVGKNRKELWMIASKPGYQMSQDGIKSGHRFSAGRRAAADPDDDREPFRIVLQEKDPTTIDFRDASGGSLVDGWLVCCLRVNIKHKGGGYGTLMLLDVPIKNGQAVLDTPLPDNTEVEVLETRLSDAHHAKLAAAHGSAPWQWRSLGPKKLFDGKPGPDPFVLEDPVRVQVTAADGRPAARTSVLFRAGGRIVQGVRTDRVGRAWLPATSAKGGFIAAADENGVAVAQVSDPASVLKMQLLPFDKVAVRAVDEDGKPVAGVGIRIGTCRVVDDDELKEWGYSIVMPYRQMAISDQDGWLQLPVPSAVCDLKLRGTRKILDGGSLSWDPDDPGKHSIVVGPLP